MSASFHAESRTCVIKCPQQAKIYASRHVKFFLNLIKIIDILLRKMQLWRTADDVAKVCRFSGFFYFSLSQACLPFGEASCGGSPCLDCLLAKRHVAAHPCLACLLAKRSENRKEFMCKI